MSRGEKEREKGVTKTEGSYCTYCPHCHTTYQHAAQLVQMIPETRHEFIYDLMI